MAALLLRATSALALIAFALGGCSRTCDDTDRRCAWNAMQNHAARKLDSWRETLSVPLEDRVGPAPPRVIEYLNLDNIAGGYAQKPRAAKLDPTLHADVRAAVSDLPPEIRELVGAKLLGLFFVDELGGSGYTEAVLDSKGKYAAAFVVFDAAVFAQVKANAWATRKERTPFKPGGSQVLEARIVADEDDNRVNAIRYTLLHELGHVIAVGTDIHPHWNVRPKDVEKDRRFPFFDLSWRINRDADRYESRFDPEFRQRSRVVYYKGAQLSAADIVPIYTALGKTDFPALYAATNPADDFAESFASYVHVVMMKRHWEITIRDGGSVTHTFKPCWEEPRCAAKRKFLEDLLKRPR